jgi:hypothetical protein
MTSLLLLTEPAGGGQVEQIARTFGVDWPQFLAQVISFDVCALSTARLFAHPGDAR